MINFRYHVVSLTAVFLALAIGLVVGTAALNGPLLDDLNDRVVGLNNNNNQLREQVDSLEDEVNRQEEFATQSAPWALTDRLLGRRVAVVSLPAANKYVDGVVEMLTTAGAKVTSRIAIQDKLTDPASSGDLLRRAHDVLPPTVLNLPRNSDGAETSSALLAAVLLDRTPAVDPTDRGNVLNEYRINGYLTVTGQATEAAEAVVVIAGTPYVDRDAANKNKAVVTVVTQFDQAAPIVVAGTGTAGEGNAVADVRGDPALNKTISTVDNVQTAQGRVATVLALAEQLKPGPTAGSVQVGHYGSDTGTWLPKLQR